MLKPISLARLLPVLAATTLLAGCGGGGDDGGGGPQPGGNVTVSGTVTYQRVPFRTVGLGLDYNATVSAPVRGAVVEAVDSGGTTVRATATTDASGNYSLQVASGRTVIVRVKAQLVRASAGAGTPSWNFRVLNNTNGEALYALDSAAFTTGSSAVTTNLNAASGWGGVSYTGTRAAAPFSLLDVAYEVLTLVQAANPNAEFPALKILWSTQNRSSNNFDPPNGNIGTTSFLAGPNGGVFVLGDANVDTDEFDQHVIAHELGHYFQDAFSRDDSLGGPHGNSDVLDLRVAFSEGWGNAFSGIVKNDPRYRDSFGAGQASDFGFDVESNPNPATSRAGWYSEASVQSLIFDFFDSTADTNDAVALGFAPIFTVMNSDLRTLDPLTSIFPMVRALKARNGGAAAGIDTLVGAQDIVSATIDDFGSTESNDDGQPLNLPVYRALPTTGTVVQVCSTSASGEYNKLGNRKLLRFTLVVRQSIQFTAVGPVNSDPDFVLHRRGEIGRSESESLDFREQFTQTLDPGSYVLEVYDFDALDEAPSPTGPVCMDVTAIVVI